MLGAVAEMLQTAYGSLTVGADHVLMIGVMLVGALAAITSFTLLTRPRGPR